MLADIVITSASFLALCVTILCHYSIIKYLKSKPLGMQTTFDTICCDLLVLLSCVVTANCTLFVTGMFLTGMTVAGVVSHREELNQCIALHMH
jgi:energy-converting hydrogenase Eha subunit B